MFLQIQCPSRIVPALLGRVAPDMEGGGKGEGTKGHILETNVTERVKEILFLLWAVKGKPLNTKASLQAL